MSQSVRRSRISLCRPSASLRPAAKHPAHADIAKRLGSFKLRNQFKCPRFAETDSKFYACVFGGLNFRSFNQLAPCHAVDLLAQARGHLSGLYYIGGIAFAQSLSFRLLYEARRS